MKKDDTKKAPAQQEKSPAQQKPYVLINDLAKLFGLYVSRTTERAGLAYGYRKLLMCLAHGEEIPQLQLVEEANLTPATVSSSMAKLEAEEIVDRRLDPKDKRKYYVQLTAKGRMHCDMIQNRSDELGRIMLEGVSGEEQEQLSRLLGIMLENLKKEGEKTVEADKIP